MPLWPLDRPRQPRIRNGAFVEVAALFLSTVTHVGSCSALVP